MSDKLSLIVESGGDFITRSASGGTISSGVTGTILTKTPPTGQRVRLTHLSTTAGTDQLGVSVLFGDVVVVDEDRLSGDNPQASGDYFSIGRFQAYGAALSRSPSKNFHQFTGKTRQSLTIVKDTGNTATDIYYGYEFGG